MPEMKNPEKNYNYMFFRKKKYSKNPQVRRKAKALL